MTFKHDFIMIITLVLIVLVPTLPIFNGITVFHFWHYIFISSAYGGYITLRLFTSYQYHLAKKKGMLREYEEINKLEKTKK